jgi:hypothetical protein
MMFVVAHFYLVEFSFEFRDFVFTDVCSIPWAPTNGISF